MKRIFSFLNEVSLELKKVTWPKVGHVATLTTMVITVSALVGVVLGSLDFAFAKAFESLLQK